MDPIAFIHALRWDDLPKPVQSWARMCLLDLIGVGLAAVDLPMARIATQVVPVEFGGAFRIPFANQTASVTGVALGTTLIIDALDGHDGYNPAKGHVGLHTLAGAIAFGQDRGRTTLTDILTAMVVGYEIGCRLSVVQHDTCPVYQTSGSWGAIAVAAIGARLRGLSVDETAHALGLAEFHGARGPMMRIIDHPTMIKDGAYGASAGASAVALAQAGFTGATAELMTSTPKVWEDLGKNWCVTQQYIKPYPVCRWAHGPIDGVLELRRAHQLSPHQVAKISVETFHESCRLATRRPKTAEEAQYSTSFPVSVALVHGQVAPQHLSGDALTNPDVLRLSDSMEFRENDRANAEFPHKRLARSSVTLTDGRVLQDEWREPRWDASAPPTLDELIAKFNDLTDPLPCDNAAIQDLVLSGHDADISQLLDLICHNPN